MDLPATAGMFLRKADRLRGRLKKHMLKIIKCSTSFSVCMIS